MVKEDRREQIRFSLSDEKKLEGACFYDPHAIEKKIEGEVMDISDGGFCISITRSSVTRPLERLNVIKAILPVAKDLPGIPTLGEVRWVMAIDDGVERYVVGVRFVI